MYMLLLVLFLARRLLPPFSRHCSYAAVRAKVRVRVRVRVSVRVGVKAWVIVIGYG
jgi:hypothetical protein